MTRNDVIYAARLIFAVDQVREWREIFKENARAGGDTEVSFTATCAETIPEGDLRVLHTTAIDMMNWLEKYAADRIKALGVQPE